MNIQDIIQQAISAEAADIFLIAGLPVTFKCDGHQERVPGDFLRPDDIRVLVEEIYDLGRRGRTRLDAGEDDDFSFAVPQMGRFRVNGALPHIDMWYDAFGVKEGDKMFIPKSERLPLW